MSYPSLTGKRALVFVLLLGMLLVISSALAQEATPEAAATEVATEVPTEAATEVPTEAATEVPTEAATEVPTEAATEIPTEAATEVPTEAPTQEPTVEATVEATVEPTVEATAETTAAPTALPTSTPEGTPEATPETTEVPTEAPGQEPPLAEVRSQYTGVDVAPAIPTEGDVRLIVQLVVERRTLEASTQSGEDESASTFVPSAPYDTPSAGADREGLGLSTLGGLDMATVMDPSALPDTAGIAAAQNALLNDLAQYAPTVLRTYEFMPFMALEIGQDGLAALRANTRVAHIQLDTVNQLLLEQSTVRIGARSSGGRVGAWEQGWDGSGRYVAILDTGVLPTHSFLSPGVVYEACYSTGGGSYLNNCPGGIEGASGASTPATCHANVLSTGYGCDHGTHVAGIAAGYTAGDINAINGVARLSNLIAVNVFSAYLGDCSSAAGTQRCPLAFDSDILAGLNYVYGLRNSGVPVDSVNMSLGSGLYSTTCDALFPSYASIINSLRNIGVATVISSGNDAFNNAISKPGCISGAVTVGATLDTSDATAIYSNEAFFLDLLAPGSNITSSVSTFGGSTTTFGSKNGTSMAAPHVAGAFAVLRERAPEASVTALLNTLQATGTSVISFNGAYVFRRINLDYALARGLLNLGGPTNQTTYGTTPEFTFSAATNATWYELLTTNSGGSTIHRQWYQVGAVVDEANDVAVAGDALAGDPNAATAGVTCSGGTCTLRPTGAVANASNSQLVYWWVRAWGPSYPAYGEFVGPLSFTSSSPTQTTPSSGAALSQADGTIDFTWQDVAGLTHYQLWVYDASRSRIHTDVWFSDAGANCTGATCSVTRGWFEDGTYYWWVRGFGPDGYTLWRGSRTFYQNAPATPAPTLNSPNSVVLNTNRVDFDWNSVTGATWYNLWVNRGGSNIINVNISSAACGGGTCSNLRDVSGSGSFTWWVRAYGPDGWSSWSVPRSFSISGQPTPTGLSLSSVADDRGDQTYSWTHDTRATWYQLWINETTTSTIYYNQWLEVGDDIFCGSGTCSIQPGVLLNNGSSYRFWVRAYGLAGYSNWAGPSNFTINLARPNAGNFALNNFRIFNNETATTFDDPYYAFNDIPGAYEYILYVYRNSPNPTLIYYATHARRTLGCGDGECTIIPPTASRYLFDGSYVWYISARGPGGLSSGGTFGAWSGAANYIIDHANIAGQAPVLNTPANGSTLTTDNTPTFAWNRQTGATWYELAVRNNTTGVWTIYPRRHQNALSCTTVGSTCQWTPSTLLNNGSYSWTVRGYGPHNNGTFGNWAGNNLFTVALPAPTAPDLLSPASLTYLSNSVTFTWSNENFATYYLLEVKRGATVVHNVWYPACSSSNCSVTLTLPGTYYSARVASYGWGTAWPTIFYSAPVNFTVLE